MAFYCLDCRFRGNDILPLGRRTAGFFIRLKCYKVILLHLTLDHSFCWERR
jgi:hypothetical protein